MHARSSFRRNLTLALIAATLGLALAPGAANAAIGSVFGDDVSCSVQPDGVRFCGSSSPRSTTKSFDGVPLDVNAAFPPKPASGPDGDYPLIMLFHGYGGGKIGLGDMQHWLDKGYATFSMTDRGFRESCGSAASRAADPSGCAKGYIRLIDNRYEVRDAQQLSGELVDEGLVDPRRIGAVGGSYGGGLSIALATLKNRVVRKNGSFAPWTSPEGTPMRLAAAAPFITWSDLAYSLVPNGGTLDYLLDAPYRGRYGVPKESFINALYLSGQSAPGYYATPGSDPDADLTSWRARLFQGEPYDGDPEAESVLDEITSHHSSYYIAGDVKPAPLLLANGFTDDLFPVDEMVRYYNRAMSSHPNADIALFVGEIAGHPRSAAKGNVLDALADRRDAWFDHYVKGAGPKPANDVTAYTTTCPTSEDGGGPFHARNWARLAPGEIRVKRATRKTIAPNGGDPAIAAKFNPITGGGSCATVDGADQPGTASYRLDPAEESGYTLLGSATVIADFTLPGKTSQVAARLLDVAPDGQETLVARGLWRPRTGGPTRQAFQLHPNGWHFAEGHVAKLELLGADSDPAGLGGYGRRSNDQQPVQVSNLQLRLPVRERPGSAPGLVRSPAPKFLPRKGDELAADFAALGDPRARLAKGPLRVEAGGLAVRVRCPERFARCTGGRVEVRSIGNRGRQRSRFAVAAGEFSVAGGSTRGVELALTARARRYFSRHDGRRVIARTTSTETTSAAVQRRRARA